MKRNVLFVLVLVVAKLAVGDDFVFNFNYDETMREATVTGLSGTVPESLILPSSVEKDDVTYSVTAIGNNAFSGKPDIKTFQIPDTIRKIGSRAFDSCHGIGDILIPASVTNLADNVFHSCSGITNAVILAQADVIDLGMFPTQSENFQTLVISGNGNTRLAHSYSSYAQRPRHIRISGVRELGTDCFYNYPNLEDIVFEDDALEIIGNSAFYGCSFTEPPGLSASSHVTSIGSGAFNYCRNLGNVVIPNSVTNIGGNAFNNCDSLSNVTITANVDSISGGIFSGQTNWVSLVIVGNGNTRVSGFTGKAIQNVAVSGVSELAKSAFENCKNLRTVDLADDGCLGNIGEWAFGGNTNLYSVAVPNTVTNIGSYAFYDCYAMTNAVIGTSVETIRYNAFQYCHSLERVEIPSSVTNVGSRVFDDCESIREVIWHGNDGTIDGSVFGGQTNWVSLVIVGNGNTRVSGFTGKAIQNVAVSGVSELARSAFENCKNLRTVDLADDGCLGNIGEWAFGSNTNLCSVIVPNTVTNIGNYAFYNCSSLKSVVFTSAEAPTVGGDAFRYLPSDAMFYICEGATGFDATTYPWNSFSVMTLMDDGSVGQSGAINESVTWSAGVPYQILAPLKVRGSSTVLTIEAGAEIRFAEGASLVVENSGSIVAAGTLENPVIFTSVAETKSAGDWEFIGGNSGRVTLRCATVEYGGGKSGTGSIYGYGARIDLDRVTVQNSGNGAICGTYVYATNSVLRASEMGVSSANWNGEIRLYNCVIDDCGTAMDNNSALAYNTIVSGCADAGSRGNFKYSLFDSDCRFTAANYGGGNIAGAPKFLADTFYRIAADSPAVDAGSGQYAPETDYFGSARMASTNVVAVGEPNGRGICPDIGIHEAEGRTEVNLPDLAVEEISLPATLTPGEAAAFTYVVTNRGDAAAFSPWVEQLWLTNGTGCVRLQSWRATEDISTNAASVRVFTVMIPDTIDLSGAVQAMVRLDTDGEVIQKDECPHEALSGSATLNGKLTLSLSDTIREGGSIRGEVKRSGGRDTALEVTLAVAGDAAAQITNMPQCVTIRAGNATAGFYVNVADNGAVDGDRAVAVTATADGFAAVQRALTIVDDEVPALTIDVIGVATNAFTEGTNLTIRVSRPAAVSDKSLTVYLSGVSTSQFTYPSSITLAAGEESAEFSFASVNDTSSELAAALRLRASASGFESAQYDFILEDDDIPSVAFTLSPEAVSEGAGLNAVYAVIERTDDDPEKLKKAITVYLTASEENAVILPGSVTIPANTMSVRFAIGVVDNEEMEDGGAREVTINAAIRIDSCGCSWPPADTGALSETLVITDNDGPALFVSVEPMTMREGLENAGILTVRANSTQVSEDVTVALMHDGPGEIALPETVTIPAGANSATATIRTLDDGEEDGSKIVSVYAFADGFAVGSSWVLVTDQNLPDFTVQNIQTGESGIIAGETVEVGFEVRNIGFQNRVSGVPYSIYWVKGDDTWRYTANDLVLSGVTDGGVATNGTLDVVAEVTAPETVGNGRIAVVIDPNGTITELDDANNSAWSDALTVSPSYVVEEVACDKPVYATGEKITVTGVAVKPNGTTRAANVEVEVYLISGNLRRMVTAVTDGNGEFAASYTPLTGEVGRFNIGASYPGLGAAAVQTTCDVAGFVLSGLASSRYVEDLTLGDVVTNASARIRNPCGIDLTGVTVEAIGMPESCGLEILGIPANGILASGDFIEFQCVFTAEKASIGKNYEKFSICLTSAEGAELAIPVYFYSQAKKAHLESAPASISATMTKGKRRTVSFNLTNLGYGEAVDVCVLSPDVEWLHVVGGAETASLTNSQSVTVTLELTPGNDIELNRNFSGRLAVNGRNKGEEEEQTFLTIPMTFMAVSEETGSITVDCVDDATYNLESAPHLEGAYVKITNPYTGEIVADGYSGPGGLFVADEIPEGTYQLVVTAAKHGNYAAAVEVNPGRMANVTAFLQYQAITANWTVTRTEIEDQYQVDLVLEFETSVPVPVVKFDFIDRIPLLQPGESYATKAVFTNLGLIRADDVSFDLPSFYGYVWIYPSGSFSLAAGAARAVPVVLHRLPYSIEGDYASYVADPGHSGETSSGMSHAAIADALGGDSASPSMSAFVAAVYGGAGMEVVQQISRAGSGTGASHAGPLQGGETDSNPCTDYAKYVYKYKCNGDRWVRGPRQLVYGDNCPHSAAPSSIRYLGTGSSEPSRNGVEQSVNIPPGMNGGDFWVFEDGCNGGVSNTLTPCLKDLAKTAVDLELMSVGKAVPGAGNVIDAFQKLGDFYEKMVNADSTISDQLNSTAELSESLANVLDDIGFESSDGYGNVLSGTKAARSIMNFYTTVTDSNSSNADKIKSGISTLKDVLDAFPDSVKNSKVASVVDSLNTIKEIDDAFDPVKKSCLPIMNGSGLPGSSLGLFGSGAASSSAASSPSRSVASRAVALLATEKTFAETVAMWSPELTQNLQIDTVAYVLDYLCAFAYFLNETFGDSDGWMNATYEELLRFLARFVLYMDEDYRFVQNDLEPLQPPAGVSDVELAVFLRRWNNMVDGIEDADDAYTEGFGAADCVRLDVLLACAKRSRAACDFAKNYTCDNIARMFTLVFIDWLNGALDSTESSSAVCAKVSLKLSQTYTMTREAFEGTLTLYNGHDTTAMTNVWLELEITNADGDTCNDLFEISAKSGGALEANGSNIVRVNDVAAKTEGTAIVQFVPAVAAAPEVPVAYNFGGKVHYRDPYSGEEATITLLPVTLEVNPMSQLYLDYFVQRDVYADNPFTKNIVEASMPAELAVLIRNEGYGDAKNVTIESAQPEIVENEKGLMIDFRLSDYTLDAAALNGATAGLGLNDVNLGTIEARSSTVAQWWLTSTLQGHFSGMRASVTHLNSQGIVDTSLIRSVDVHALIRSVDVGDALPAFLTADHSRYGNPDKLYRADGEVLDVRNDVTASVSGSIGGMTCSVTITTALPGSGPYYTKVKLPGAEDYEVIGVVDAAGAVLPVRNAWITDRTFVDGADPRIETHLHLFNVEANAGTKSYTVTLKAKPSDAPEVTGFEGVTADALVTNPVENLVVTFSKAIDPASFTPDDITVRYQGELTNGVAAISSEDETNTRYTLTFDPDFAELEGRFIVQVFSSGVTSLSGTLGKSSGRQIGWTYYIIEKPAVVSIKGWLEGTTVNSVSNVTVQFAAAIDPASFTADAIKVDGYMVSDSAVSITPLNKANTSFRILGLDAAVAAATSGATLLSANASASTHTIEIDTRTIRNASGVYGQAIFSSTVTIDSNAPTATLTDEGEQFGSHRWTLTFSKPILASSVTVAGFTLTRDGARIELPASAKVVQVSETQFTFSGIDALITQDGMYALTFDAATVKDASGNAGVGTTGDMTWEYRDLPPAVIADLAFTPDYGTNDTDGVTWQRDVTVTGTLGADVYAVTILARDAAGTEDVLMETFYPESGETSLEKAVTLPVGRGVLVVRCANVSGKTSDSEKEFFIDAIPLSFTFAGFPDGGKGKLTNDVQIVFSDPVRQVAAEWFSIRHGVREWIAFEPDALTITTDESNLVWTVAGLDALTASGGTYTVTLDISRVEKRSSGLAGEFDADTCGISWSYTPPDTTPPELLQIVFDGMEVYGETGALTVASNGASQVKFIFSEAVNLSALKAGGWLDRAIRLQLLDESGTVTGEVAAASSQFRWRGSENAIVWTRSERALPVGKLRLFLDAGLIADTAGNPLKGNSELDSFIRFSKPDPLFNADGEYAVPATVDGGLVVGVKKNGKGEAYHYDFAGTKDACVVDNVVASNCLGVSVAKVGGDLYYGTYDGKVYRNGVFLEGVNAGRERAVLSVWNGGLVIGGDDGRLLRLDGTALKNRSGADLVVDPVLPRRSAAAFSGDWIYEGQPLLVTGHGKGGLALYVGDEAGTWDDVKPFTLAGAANTNLYERSRPVAVDVNGDGLDDLVTGYADGSLDVRYAAVNKAFTYTFEALPFHTLEEALDTDEQAPNLIWTTSAEQPWLAQTGEACYGNDYAISSAAANQESTLAVRVVGPGTLRFHWKKVGTAGTYCVKTNGVEALTCSVETWSESALVLGSGFVQVAFIAANGASGYLDCVSWEEDASASDDEKALQAEKAVYDESFVAFMVRYGGIDPATATATDYLRAMSSPTGKLGMGGTPITLLDEFIAGTVPTDMNDRFYATITLEDGNVYIGWVPNLNEDGQIRRVYAIYGKREITDEWSAEPLTEEEINSGYYRFFLVMVEMP